MFLVSNVPACPASSVPTFPVSNAMMFPSSNALMFPVSSVPMFPGSSVSRFQCNSAQKRKGSTEENEETFKSRQVFTSHKTTCHQASVFQRRALRETHRALFLIVIYFHTIYHYLFYQKRKKNSEKNRLNKTVQY